ncbi:hypothetical protein [Azotobacter chroococcum]|uniref:hypothetical protein n=1 Tax=Azotobacter chroococcum TaxID=353 RepID=UPI0010AE99B4|nr:hypothetical protein [Azotobacter chroococcum]TKD39930.1 hypothetical protein FCG41_11900 [Azotobacter chroococcum]
MSNLAHDLDELFDAQVDVENSRGYDDEPMGSDLAELVGRLTPSPAADPDFGKTPRQIEREAEAEREENPAVKGAGILELFGEDHGLSDAQRGDLASERALAEELVEQQEQQVLQEALADPESYELEYLPELVEHAQQEVEHAQQTLVQLQDTFRQQSAQLDQQMHQATVARATAAQAFAAAQQAGDQEAMQRAYLATQQLDQAAAQLDQARQQQAQIGELAHFAIEDENAFRARQPDYSGAYQFIDQQLDQLARDRYPGTPPKMHEQLKNYVRLRFIDCCRQNGISVAEAIYSKAKELGYQPIAPTRAVKKVSRQPEATASVQTDPQQAPATSQAPMPTLEEVARMDPDQFERFWSQLDKRSRNADMPRGW